MCFFRRKKVAEKTKENQEAIELNSKSIDVLVVLAEGKEDVVAELNDIKEKLTFLLPSDKAVNVDKKIKNLIGDLKIALTKSEGEMSGKVSEIIKEIELAIAERAALIWLEELCGHLKVNMKNWLVRK